MARKADQETLEEVCSESSECSQPHHRTTAPMGTPLRNVFDRISGLAAPWRRTATPRGRRIFHRDVEREEFPYSNSHCLSSYYSVFVARLAIMVSDKKRKKKGKRKKIISFALLLSFDLYVTQALKV